MGVTKTENFGQIGGQIGGQIETIHRQCMYVYVSKFAVLYMYRWTPSVC